MTERLLNSKVVAEILDVSPDTVRRWVRRGELPAVVLNGTQNKTIRFRESDINEWISRRPKASR